MNKILILITIILFSCGKEDIKPKETIKQSLFGMYKSKQTGFFIEYQKEDQIKIRLAADSLGLLTRTFKNVTVLEESDTVIEVIDSNQKFRLSIKNDKYKLVSTLGNSISKHDMLKVK